MTWLETQRALFFDQSSGKILKHVKDLFQWQVEKEEKHSETDF
jgi:hypothetical protein